MSTADLLSYNQGKQHSPWQKQKQSFLPPINHTFGLANKKDDFGAGKLVSSWHVHTRSVDIR